jgi:hypothetical protein
LLEGQSALLAAISAGSSADGLLIDGPVSASQGLQIYRHAYRTRLREALTDNYSALARALGDERFAALADRYADWQPPHAAHLRPYGDRLCELVDDLAASEAGAAIVPHPAYGDLARMDRALRDAFDAIDHPSLKFAELASLPADHWPQLQLRLLPSARLVPLLWGVESAWHQLQSAAEGAEPALEPPPTHRHTLLVWRRDLDTHWRALGDEEADVLASVLRGLCFGELSEQLASLLDDPTQASARLVGHLQQWLADGCLAAADADADGSRS